MAFQRKFAKNLAACCGARVGIAARRSKIKDVKLLIFSDIHSNAKALQRLMSTEADYYFCAGDLVSWARGLDKMGESFRLRARPRDMGHSSTRQILTSLPI